jgi:hypothetical protein
MSLVLHEAMYCPEVIEGLIHRHGAGLNPLDEDTGHRHTELGAFFSVAADLPIEAFELNPLARFHHRAFQHSRQFFVKSSKSEAWPSFRGFDQLLAAEDSSSWHKGFKFA